MKAFVASVVALAASTGASPAADPQLLVNGLGYTSGVAVGVVPEVALKDTGLVHHAGSGAVTPDFTDAQKEANPEIAKDATKIKKYALTGNAKVVAGVNPVVGYGYGLPATHQVLYGKREAEADPALFYTAGVVPAVHPVVSTSGLVAHPDGAVTPDYTPAQKVAAAQHFAAKGAYALPLHPVYHTYGKREADAEAKPYWGYGGYGLPATTLGYGYPRVYHTYGKRDADAEAKPYWGYGGYGLPATTLGYGYPRVYHTYGKRDADAEAKPYWGYGGYGLPATTLGYGYPSVYHTYGKREAEAKPYYGYGYGLPATTYSYGYPSVYHTFGKREAEAEAKPYYGYGYGLPATTYSYGYPSVYHTYGKREAEAEAKPYWGYGGYGLPAYGGYAYPGYYY